MKSFLKGKSPPDSLDSMPGRGGRLGPVGSSTLALHRPLRRPGGRAAARRRRRRSSAGGCAPGEDPGSPLSPLFYRRTDAAPRRLGPWPALKPRSTLGTDSPRSRRRPPPALPVAALPPRRCHRPPPAPAARSGRSDRARHDAVQRQPEPRPPVPWLPPAPCRRRPADRAHRAGGDRLAALGIAGAHRRHPARSARRSPAAARPPQDGRLTLVAFGKMRPYKGLDVLVEAVARLDDDTRARLRVIVAGEPMIDLAPLRRGIADADLSGTIDLVRAASTTPEAAALLDPPTPSSSLPPDRRERGLLPRVRGPRPLADPLAARAFAEASRTASRAGWSPWGTRRRSPTRCARSPARGAGGHAPPRRRRLAGDRAGDDRGLRGRPARPARGRGPWKPVGAHRLVRDPGGRTSAPIDLRGCGSQFRRPLALLAAAILLPAAAPDRQRVPAAGLSDARRRCCSARPCSSARSPTC